MSKILQSKEQFKEIIQDYLQYSNKNEKKANPSMQFNFPEPLNSI